MSGAGSRKRKLRLDEHDTHESHLSQLNRDAVNFLHLHPEVRRKEYGYSVGEKGLDPDYYQGGKVKWKS
jgi:hypothetical protein